MCIRDRSREEDRREGGNQTEWKEFQQRIRNLKWGHSNDEFKIKKFFRGEARNKTSEHCPKNSFAVRSATVWNWQDLSVLPWTDAIISHNFSHDLSRCMGAVMIFLAWMSLAVLYWIVSHFLAGPVERKCYLVEQEDSLRPLFKAIVYTRSWVRNNVNNSSCGRLTVC